MLPAQIYIAIGTAIITATVTLLAVYLTNRGNTNRLKIQLEHERNTKQDAIYRDKLEELYVVAHKWITLLGSHMLPYLRVMEGDLDYNQALDMTIAQGKEDLPDFERLQMLIDLYFPQLTEPLKELRDARDAANKIMAIHKMEYKQGNVDGRKFVDPMLAALKQIDETGEQLKAAISSRMERRYNK